MGGIIRKATIGKKKFAIFESRIRDLAINDLSIDELIALSDELIFKLRRVAEEILSREDCDEISLRHILRYSPKEMRKKAAKRLLMDFPTRDNLSLIIRHCEDYRRQAWEMLKEKDPTNAEAIFLSSIYKE